MALFPTGNPFVAARDIDIDHSESSAGPPPSDQAQSAQSQEGWWSWVANVRDGATDLVLNRFNKLTLQPALARQKVQLEALSGSKALHEFLHSLVVIKGPSFLKDLKEEKSLKGAIVKYVVEKDADLTPNTIEANLNQMVINLIAKAQTLSKDPLPTSVAPAEFLSNVITLIVGLDEKKAKEIQKEIDKIDAEPTKPIDKLMKKEKLFDSMAQKFLRDALPKGKEDLIIPDAWFVHPLRMFAYNKIKSSLPDLLGKQCWKIWKFTSESHPKNVATVKSRPGGEALLAELEKGVTLGSYLLGEKAKGPEMKKAVLDPTATYTAQEIEAQQLQNPPDAIQLLLQKAGDETAIKNLLKKLDQYSYPLFVHVLASLTKAAELDGVDKSLPVLSAVVETLLNSFFNFNVNPTKKEDFVPLVDELLKKCGLDKVALSTIVEGFTDKIEGIRTDLLDFVADYHDEVIKKRGVRPAVAASVEGYEEGRLLLEGVIKKLTPSIQEALKDEENQEVIVELMADSADPYLDKMKTQLPQALVGDSLKNLIGKSEHWPVVHQFAQPYLVDGVSSFFAHFAASCPPSPEQPKTDMVTSSIPHLLRMIETQVKDPNLEAKLQAWKAMPEGKAKSDKRVLLRNELFGPCVHEILEKGGWNQLENIPAPKKGKLLLHWLMATIVLPDLLFMMYCDTKISEPLSDLDKRRLEKMGGEKAVEALTAGVAEMYIPKIFAKIRQRGEFITANINEKLALSSLDIEQEAWLGSKLDELLAVNRKDVHSASVYSEDFLFNFLKSGLINLGLNYNGPNQGSLENNIGLYFREFLKDILIDSRLAEKIRFYKRDTAELRTLDYRLNLLRRQAIEEKKRGGVKPETVAALQKLKAERVDKEKELDDKYKIRKAHRDLLKEFEPKVRQLLTDMGRNAETLISPFLKPLHKDLIEIYLPELCLDKAEELIAAVDDLIPESKELVVLENKFKERYERNRTSGDKKLAEADRAPLVEGIYKVADYFVKLAESQVALRGKTWASDALNSHIIPQFYGGDKGRKAATTLLDPNSGKIASWIGEESSPFVKFLKERIGKSLQGMVGEPILAFFNHVFNNLEEIEKKNPEVLFDFVCECVPLVSKHFATAKKSADNAGKGSIGEDDPVHQTMEFEKAEQLHPAMPNYLEMKALQEQKHYIQQLEAQCKGHFHENWYQKVDRLKSLQNGPAAARDQLKLGPDYYLAEARGSLNQMQRHLEEKMVKNSYDKLSKLLLKMGGLEGPQDIPGGTAFWGLFGMTQAEGWAAIQVKAPYLLMEAMNTLFAPENTNGYLANLLISLNENLKKNRIKGEIYPSLFRAREPLDPKIEMLKQRCIVMFDQLKKILPEAVITQLSEIHFIEHIPGQELAKSLHEALKQNPLSKLVEIGLTAFIQKLPEKLPMTLEELAKVNKEKAEENKNNIDTISKEGMKILPLLIRKIEQNLFILWERLQVEFDHWVRRVLGPGGVRAKEISDKIFRTIFINYIMGIPYELVKRALFFGIDTYAKYKGSKDIEKGRASVIDAQINRNLLFKIGDQFMKFYGPAPAAA